SRPFHVDLRRSALPHSRPARHRLDRTRRRKSFQRTGHHRRPHGSVNFWSAAPPPLSLYFKMIDIRRILIFAILSTFCAVALAVEPCRIEIAEKGTGWPVPLVELRTVNQIRFFSDNDG